MKLPKQLSEGFKKPVYWNKYKVIESNVIEIATVNPLNNNPTKWPKTRKQFL